MKFLLINSANYVDLIWFIWCWMFNMVHLQKTLSIFRAAVSYLHCLKDESIWESYSPNIGAWGTNKRSIPTPRKGNDQQLFIDGRNVPPKNNLRTIVYHEINSTTDLLSALQGFMISDKSTSLIGLYGPKRNFTWIIPKTLLSLVDWTSRVVLLRNNLSHNP